MTPLGRASPAGSRSLPWRGDARCHLKHRPRVMPMTKRVGLGALAVPPLSLHGVDDDDLRCGHHALRSRLGVGTLTAPLLARHREHTSDRS